jgi:hypothetical protein
MVKNLNSSILAMTMADSPPFLPIMQHLTHEHAPKHHQQVLKKWKVNELTVACCLLLVSLVPQPVSHARSCVLSSRNNNQPFQHVRVKVGKQWFKWGEQMTSQERRIVVNKVSLGSGSHS